MSDAGPPAVWLRDGYEITTDASRFDLAAVHAYLTRSYWSPGIPYATVVRAVAGSLAFGLFHGVRHRKVEPLRRPAPGPLPA